MKKSVKILWLVAFGFLGFIILLVLLINFRIIGGMPSLDELENPRASLASEVIAEDGTILGKYYQVDRSSSDYNEISKNVINALIATEESRFYDNSGIDPKGTLAIPFYLLIGKKRGSSTITQQLALNLQADNGKQRSSNPLYRGFQKIQEWIMAIKLERNFTKQEILTLYLNTVAFGDNVYGIENGARTFFSKDAGHLSIEEAAVLVGMLKGNTIYNPRRNPQNALIRRNTVIDNMLKEKFITPAEAASAKSKPIVLHYNKIDHNKGLAPYFREVLRDELKGWCKTHKKSDGSEYNLYRDGLKIYTTINPRMQLYAEEAVAKHLAVLQKSLFAQNDIKTGNVWKKWPKFLDQYMKESDRYKAMKEDEASDSAIAKAFNTPTRMKVFGWKSATEPDLNEIDTVMTPLDSIKYMRAILQAGFMAMDPESGEVKAWVGGPDFRYFKNDHVAKTRRQVGSTFKPFLYCFAIMNGMSPNTVLPNEPININGWQPKNSEGSTGGSITMAGALAKSLNLVAAYLIKQIGAKAFADFAKNKVGFSSDIPAYPAIALGAVEISLYELMQGYTMFPGRGINTKPIYITRIEDRNGNILETFAPVKREVISEKEAYTMVKMMEGVVAPGGTGARVRSRYNIQGEIAGKTGTTNDNTDGWFMGYTPKLLAGAWVGCENNFIHFSTTAVGQGANTGLPIWALFMQKVYADPTLKIGSNDHFPVPPNMAEDDIYMNYDSNVQPGAESENVGNGSADDYGSGAADDFAQPGYDQPEPTKPAKPKENKENNKEKEEQKPAPKATMPAQPKKDH
ncbi:penicillin-binding protein 1A [Chitinophaga terrae (ex Kim and Jung 2007)]|uniref:Penicillin-binding protein 1A n=1 Tax=Chitinophaga terrae (ex Kim and Jung 2007) TaxID=408074 RepID=A0A1H4E5B8_9BACT|nr:transglycosylase domain-containing protein [Chitinophaga terrae (ex Kim and Jung 2007)]GEP91388.1 penicillin-binding protein 1A [Chitinophaga terrae (ex Kim and Jung 2007)]SEA80116.1 penicillin-binding protein 1A [Chitinophaga terrae (ex Kim and Jung 2007)]